MLWLYKFVVVVDQNLMTVVCKHILPRCTESDYYQGKYASKNSHLDSKDRSSLTHLLIHSFIHSFIYPFIHLLTPPANMF